MATPGTIPVSGPSTADSNKLPGKWNGETYSMAPEGPFPDPYNPVCRELHALLTRKRGYYGCPDESPLANARGVAEQGIDPWLYQLARIGEKVRRAGGLQAGLRTLIHSSKSALMRKVRETLLDIAGHAVVAIALIDSENPREDSDES